MFGKKVSKDKFGVPKRISNNTISVGEWEDIPEVDKHKVTRSLHQGQSVIYSDMDNALRLAQDDRSKRFK